MRQRSGTFQDPQYLLPLFVSRTTLSRLQARLSLSFATVTPLFPPTSEGQISTMLDTFEILTTSGVVLWSKSYSAISPAVINSLITNVFIEERTLPGAGIADDISAANNPPYKYDQHTLKWTTVKELNLIFVVSCQRLRNPRPRRMRMLID